MYKLNLKKGFSLASLVVSMIIISILLLMGSVNYKSKTIESKELVTETEVEMLELLINGELSNTMDDNSIEDNILKEIGMGSKRFKDEKLNASGLTYNNVVMFNKFGKLNEGDKDQMIDFLSTSPRVYKVNPTDFLKKNFDGEFFYIVDHNNEPETLDYNVIYVVVK